MIPVLGGEGEQCIGVLRQASGRLGVLGRVLLDGDGDRGLGTCPIGGISDLGEIGLHRALDRFRHLVQDIGHRVK